MHLVRKRRRSSDTDDSMIPMINMVFLLLIFFMVAGTVRPSPPLPVEPPKSSVETESLAQRVLHVGTNGSLVLGKTPVLESDLPVALKKHSGGSSANPMADRADVGSVDGSGGFSSDKLPLAIRADAEISIKRLREIIALVRSAGLSEVELLTTLVSAHGEPQGDSEQPNTAKVPTSP